MILGQSAPAATTPTDVYTNPPKFTATFRVLLCNRAASAATYRIAVRKGGAALSNEHYVAYDREIDASGDHHTVPIETEPGDVVTVYASTANLSFTVSGVEEPEAE